MKFVRECGKLSALLFSVGENGSVGRFWEFLFEKAADILVVLEMIDAVMFVEAEAWKEKQIWRR